MLAPHLTYEGGSSTVDARTHTIAIAAVISNDSPRGWKITGATVDAAGTASAVAMPAVEIPAHGRRTVHGVARVDHCDALPAAPGQLGYGHTGDMTLHVQRLFASSSFTVRAVLDDDIVRERAARERAARRNASAP